MKKLTPYLLSLCVPVFWVLSSNLFAQKQNINIITVTPKQNDEIVEIIKHMKPYQTIFFKEGTYKIRSSIGIDKKSYLKIVAEDGVYIVLEDVHVPVLWIHESDNIEIKGLHAKHRRLVYPGEVCNGAVISITNSHDINLSNMELNGSGTEGVWINKSTSIAVHNSWIHSNSVAGISLVKFADNIVIENNRFENNPVHITSSFLQDKDWAKYVKMKNNSYDAVFKLQ